MALNSKATFQHLPSEWTVGDLQGALEGLPPHTRLSIHVALDPGRNEWEQQVVVDLWKPAALDDENRIAVILADMPAGIYLKAPQDTR